jgi:hypothetical protein
MGRRAKDAAQVPRAEYHKMVDALAADRANQPFCITVLPRGCDPRSVMAITGRWSEASFAIDAREGDQRRRATTANKKLERKRA